VAMRQAGEGGIGDSPATEVAPPAVRDSLSTTYKILLFNDEANRGRKYTPIHTFVKCISYLIENIGQM